MKIDKRDGVIFHIRYNGSEETVFVSIDKNNALSVRCRDEYYQDSDIGWRVILIEQHFEVKPMIVKSAERLDYYDDGEAEGVESPIVDSLSINEVKELIIALSEGIEEKIDLSYKVENIRNHRDHDAITKMTYYMYLRALQVFIREIRAVGIVEKSETKNKHGFWIRIDARPF